MHGGPYQSTRRRVRAVLEQTRERAAFDIVARQQIEVSAGDPHLERQGGADVGIAGQAEQNRAGHGVAGDDPDRALAAVAGPQVFEDDGGAVRLDDALPQAVVLARRVRDRRGWRAWSER
jgi:hypothetical protein